MESTEPKGKNLFFSGIPLARDNDYNRGVLTDAMYATLEEKSDVKGLEYEYYVYKNIQIAVFDNKFISTLDSQKISIALGRTPAEYEPVKVKGEGELKMPINFAVAKAILVNVVKSSNETKSVPIYDCSIDNMAYLISLFTIFPGFGPIYDEYVTDVDAGVVLAEKDFETKLTPETGKALKENDIKATAHILLLLMSKSFSNDPTRMKDHIISYLQNRSKAICFTLSTPEVKILLNPSGLEKMCGIWNLYPKLKTKIFYYVFSQRTLENCFSSALMLLANSAMVTINCIVKFIEARALSLAHTNPVIWTETELFLHEIQALKEDLGSLWVYLRVLRPGNLTLAASKFPNLARAAIEYNKAFVNTSASFAQVAIPQYPTEPGISKQARKLLDKKYLNESGQKGIQQFTESQQKIARAFGLDLSKWEATDKLRQGLRIDDDPETEIETDTLRKIMNLLNKESSK